MTCDLTNIIHGKGWTVTAACKFWGIRYDVWRRSCRNTENKSLRAKLISQCNGLEDKNNATI